MILRDFLTQRTRRFSQRAQRVFLFVFINFDVRDCAQLFTESPSLGELSDDETFFLMPCQDRVLRPLRMRAMRRLTLEEFRMGLKRAVRAA